MYFVMRKLKINIIIKNNPKGCVGVIYCVPTHTYTPPSGDVTGSDRQHEAVMFSLQIDYNVLVMTYLSHKKDIESLFWSGPVRVCLLTGTPSSSFPTGSDWKWNVEFISASVVV